MPDTRKREFEHGYVDLNGRRQIPLYLAIRGNRPKFQRWCDCGRLTPTNLECWKRGRCESCDKRLRPTFSQFLLAQIEPADDLCSPSTTAATHHRGVTIGDLYEQSI
jgi:hypothetical protein